MKIKLLPIMGLVAAAGMALPLNAGLVAKWDFNNYDPANPTSANVLQATVGDDGQPCYYVGKGTAVVSDGTIGHMYMVTPDYSGSDAEVATACARLGAGNYAIAIPKSSHLKLPLPTSVRNHNFTVKVRFWSPAASTKKYRAFFNFGSNTADAKLFIRSSDNKIGGGSFFRNGSANYSQVITDSVWHTITFSAGAQRWDLFLDETIEAGYANNGNGKPYFNYDYVLFCADENGEDELMYIDYIEFYDEASVYEGKLPHYSKAGLTGEWTFPADNPLKAAIGRDLEKYTRTGAASFVDGTDGVLPGDSYTRVGQNNALKCYHGLSANANYTVVMDLRVKTCTDQKWHGLFKGQDVNDDADLFLTADGPEGTLRIRSRSERYTNTGVAFGEWMRVTITHLNGANKKVYINGALKDTATKSPTRMDTAKGGYFLLLGDDNGEDFDTDISYAAVYDRILTDAEVAELHSRPLAQRADDSFVPTVAPAGVWTADGEGGFAATKGMSLTADGSKWKWMRSSAPAAATYVFDLALPAEQTAGGVLVMNASGVASGIYGTTSTYSGSFHTTTDASTFLNNTYLSTWGYWSENALDRTDAHRVAVTWAANGLVHYYVDGRPWGQLFPANANISLKPSVTMTFLDGLASGATRVAAYDAALTPDEVASLGGVDKVPSGNAPAAPTIAATITETPVKALVDAVSFTVTGTHPNGEYMSFAIDFGDGTGDGTTKLVPSGTAVTFSHVFNAGGTFTPRVKAISQNGVESEWAACDPIEVELIAIAARDVLVTWPWQQNVYTNRFTIMCEGVKDADDITRWDGLEVQYGNGYSQRATMTRVEGNGGTWIYSAHITVDGAEGQMVPYRLGYYGLPLTYENAADNTEGIVLLWSQNDNESFTCSVWGDNQQGARDRDWDSDKYLYITRLFEHMLSRDVDFGISTGDMASSANYDTQIRPGILERTDAIFGRVKPYYVAWGNHDTSYPADKPYFETGAVDEPAYGSSASGNYYLYRGNVLFIFIDHGLMTAAATKTWLADLLATERAQGAKFRILAQHYPFWLECWGGNNNTALLDTAKAGGVDMVLSGHMHGYERIYKDGIMQVTNGGAGYLDHVESVNANYGDATFVGGHRDVPYLWARQKSVTETDVLGPAEPVRMGCLQGYGELKVDGNVLTYSAHGFNADGSYIGVFDEFSITSKTVAATAPAPSQHASCADPSAFAQFTEKPVTNAKWKEYKDAVGEAFTFPEGRDDAPAVNVSKNDIEKFIAWLGGGYRLPTVDELETAFGGEMRREVAEWTATVDLVSGWCRILGSPALSQEGTWMRAADKPSIATAGCHANYLGFRLATGPSPDEPIGPRTPLDPALNALGQIDNPAAVYKWDEGSRSLVDITAEWENPSGDLSYDVPVVFTGEGEVVYNMGSFNVTLGGGFAAPKSTLFRKGGSGSLTVKGYVKSGVCDSANGWRICSDGELECDGVTFSGQGVQFFAADGALRLKGDNDFSGADIVVDATILDEAAANCTNYVAAAAERATFRARRITNKGANFTGIGENVSVTLSKDYQFGGSYQLEVEGSIDADAFNMLGNHDPLIVGAGTMSMGYIGYAVNAWPRLGVSNLVFTTARPFRSNTPSTKSYYGIFIGGQTVNISSTCGWTVPAKDHFGMPIYFVADTRDGTLCTRPTVTFDGPHDVLYAPTASAATLSNTAFTSPWDIEKTGTGTLTMKTAIKGDIAVNGGTVKISAMPCEGATSASGDGRWAIDEALALTAGQRINGAFVPGGTLSYNFAGNGVGEYLVLKGCGLSEGDIAVETSLDAADSLTVKRDWTGGDLRLVVEPVGKRIAEWTGGGAAGKPLDSANWRVMEGGVEVPGAVPDASTFIRIAGAVTLSFPVTEGFEYAGLMLADDAALAADCDWRGLGAVALRDGAFIDLRGRRLDVSGFTGVTAGKAGVTDSTTDEEHPGELHLHVAEGATLTNDKAAFTGNLKLVKDGAGTYVAAFAPQTYTGGTLVAEGTARPPDGNGANTTYSGDAFKAFGPGISNIIEVAEGATFDLRANYAYRNFVSLAGGMLRNSAADMTKTTWGGSGIGMLSRNSHLDVARSIVYGDVNGYGDTDLSGNTLTVGIAAGKYLYLRCKAMRDGRVDLVSGGWLQPVVAVDASTVDFRVGCALNLTSPLDVRDYEPVWNGAAYNRGAAALNVHGAFRPAAHDLFYGCTMLDGSTLDLVNRTTPLPMTAAFTDGGKKTLEFASGATVKVRVDARAFGEGEKLVEWNAPPAGVTFVSDRAGLKVEAREDGLYLVNIGTLIIVR